jgi:hypothetical protein
MSTGVEESTLTAAASMFCIFFFTVIMIINILTIDDRRLLSLQLHLTHELRLWSSRVRDVWIKLLWRNSTANSAKLLKAWPGCLRSLLWFWLSNGSFLWGSSSDAFDLI